VDSLTDLAAKYMLALCRATAVHADLNPSMGAPTVVHVRMALQDVGALGPEIHEMEQEYTGVEDMRGVEAFISFATGPLCREIRRIALEGEDDATDYLSVLMKKHSKSEDDSKWTGTLLGKPYEQGEVLIEGGPAGSIEEWRSKLLQAAEARPDLTASEADLNATSIVNSPGSSVLSSIGDADLGEDGSL